MRSSNRDLARGRLPRGPDPVSTATEAPSASAIRYSAAEIRTSADTDDLDFRGMDPGSEDVGPVLERLHEGEIVAFGDAQFPEAAFIPVDADARGSRFRYVSDRPDEVRVAFAKVTGEMTYPVGRASGDDGSFVPFEGSKQKISISGHPLFHAGVGPSHDDRYGPFDRAGGRGRDHLSPSRRTPVGSATAAISRSHIAEPMSASVSPAAKLKRWSDRREVSIMNRAVLSWTALA